MKKVIITLAVVLMAGPAFGASFTLTVPNEVVGDVVNAFCTLYNYQPTVTDENGDEIANPETKVQFSKRMIRQYVRNVYRAYKVQALEEQRKTILNEADTASDGVSVE